MTPTFEPPPRSTRFALDALWVAIDVDDPRTIRFVAVAFGPDALRATDSSGRTAVAVACRAGSAGALEALLALQFDMHTPDPHGNMPLHESLRHRTPKCLRLLLAHGARATDRSSDGDTPICMAVRFRNRRALETLLEHDTSQIDHTNSLGMSPIQWAVHLHSADLVETLLRHGANPSLRCPMTAGSTALHVAVSRSRSSCPSRELELLLAHGAATDITDNRGRTPSQLARESGLTEIAERIEAHARSRRLSQRTESTAGAPPPSPAL